MSKESQGSVLDPARFSRMSIVADAGFSGYEYAQEARLPRIPERWDRPDLKDAWIGGYLTELRNRLESTERR